MLTTALSVCTAEELAQDKITTERRNDLKKKFEKAVTMVKVCSTITENRECAIKLEGLAPVPSDTRSPKKLLGTKRGRINSFDEAKDIDSINEMLPPVRRSERIANNDN